MGVSVGVDVEDTELNAMTAMIAVFNIQTRVERCEVEGSTQTEGECRETYIYISV